MRLLLVAYDFPPVGGIGVQRMVKFARYLPEFGVEARVLTPAHGLGRARDEGLLARNGLQSLPVFRRGGERLAAFHRWRDGGDRFPWRLAPALTWSTLRYSDVFGLWYDSLRGELDDFARDQRIDAVLTTVPHASSCFFGLHLARGLGLPWIVDIRDSMVANADRRVMHGIAQLQAWRLRHLERHFVRHADLVLAVSAPIVENMVARTGEDQRAKFLLLPNGYDAADFPAAVVPARNDKLTLVYAGSFVGRRRPEPLVAGINRAIARRDIDPARVCVHFYGQYAPDVVDAIGRLDPAVERHLHGFVPQHEAIAAAAAADVVLLVTVPGNDSAAQEVMTGKVYECMALQRYLLALTDAEPLAQLVRQARLGESCGAADTAAVAAALGRLYVRWASGASLAVDPDPAVVVRYERRAQAGMLAARLQALLAEKSGGKR